MFTDRRVKTIIASAYRAMSYNSGRIIGSMIEETAKNSWLNSVVTANWPDHQVERIKAEVIHKAEHGTFKPKKERV